MIIKGLFTLIINLLELLFGWVSFPPMPAAVTSVFETLIGYIGDAMGFVWLIVPKELVLVLLPVVLILSNFDKLYGVIMLILRKIPFLSIE